jgi:hypothetical protein
LKDNHIPMLITIMDTISAPVSSLMLALIWPLPKRNVSKSSPLSAKEKGSLGLTRHVVFAPVALLIRYDRVEEAIEIANGTRFGLGAGVFGPDQRDCITVAKQLECGMVAVNDFGVFYVRAVVFITVVWPV